jgi:hypothetical protein
VEQVVGSVDPQSAEALIVRSRGQRRKVPVASVDVVVPAARLIVIAGGRRDSELQQGARALVQTSSRAAGAAVYTVRRSGGVAHTSPARLCYSSSQVY